MIQDNIFDYNMRKAVIGMDYCYFCNKNPDKHNVPECPIRKRYLEATKIMGENKPSAEEISDKVVERLGENPFKNKYLRLKQEVFCMAKCDEYEGLLSEEEVSMIKSRKNILLIGEESYKDRIFNQMKIEQNNGNNVFVQFLVPYENEDTIKNNRELILECIDKILICDEYQFIGYKKSEDDDIGSDFTLVKYILNIVRNQRNY